METITYNNITYVLSDYILQNAPIFCRSIRNSRDLVKRKNISEDNFIFARKNKKSNEWIISDGKSPKVDKVFIVETYIQEIPELNSNNITADSEQKIVDDRGIEKAPYIIYLKDSEKFKDETGNSLDIETRGIRKCNGIYFRVKDIEKCFEMESLQHNIIRTIASYVENIDYKYFICEKRTNCPNSTNKELFLTYQGMLRCLMVSRNKKTSHFISWATESLFTIQMGTEEQKNQLVANIKGVSYESIQEIFSVSSTDLPCIYLTHLNNVKTLREEMKLDESYDDNDIVFKFGLTKSFEKRKYGHKSEFKKINHLIDMKICCFSWIDPLYISQAETELKNILNDYKITYDKNDELIVLSSNTLRLVKTLYENISKKFSGHTYELNEKIKQLENEKELLRKENEKELLKKENEYELLKRENEKELLKKKNEYEIYKITKDKDFEILRLEKELEIAQLKLQLSQSK